MKRNKAGFPSIIATLLVVVAAVLFCCFRMKQRQRPVSQAIERCLGMPVEACDIVSNLLLAAEESGGRDVSFDLVHQLLKEKKATQNLLVGILFIRSEADLDFELLTSEPFPRAVLEKLTIDANKTLLLVRPEHIGVVETRQESDGTISGSFDWTIDGLMKGKCNFIYKTGSLIYLGFARRNSLGTYDSQHIFYCSDDNVVFPYWKGRAVVLPFRRKHFYDFGDMELAEWQVRDYYAVVHLDAIDTLRDTFRKTSFEQWLVQQGCSPQGGRPILISQGLDAGYALVMATTSEDLESAVDALIDEFGVTLCGKEILLREYRGKAREMKELQALVSRHKEAPSKE